jgi:hypothetical protein
LPAHDRLKAERLLRELKIRVDIKTLAKLLKLLQRYGVKFEGERLDRLINETAKLRS